MRTPQFVPKGRVEMKLAFSTLGCPDWRWSDIISTAKDLQFDGVEVRGVANEMYVPHIRAFDAEHIAKNTEKLRAMKLAVPMLASGVTLGAPYDREQGPAAAAKDYIDLAEKLGTPYIRVMATGRPEPEEADLSRAAELYEEICEYAREKKVTPLLETNGVLADSRKMAEFMEGIESRNKGALWDIHHPFRYFGEDPRETWRSIGRYVKYVHVKDSVNRGGTIVYRMMGYGDVPVFDALKTLGENHYDGFVSLEWVKRWNPDLEEPGIVFAHFMSYMGFLMERLGG